jgi:flagellar hook-associated protein 2
MSSSTTSSSSSTVSSSSNRITGLATGLDVDSIVTGLTTGTQTKIDEGNQALQLLEWKQEDYESVTDALYKFENTYCGSSSFALSIADDLKKLTATNSGTNYLSVTTSSDSTSGSVYIADIKSLATGAAVTSSSTVSSNPLITVDTGTVSKLTGTTMSVTLDGVTKTLTFSGTYSTSSGVATDMQSLLDSAFGSGRITVADNNNNTISLSAENSTLVIANTSSTTDTDSSKILSFTDGASNRIDLSDTLAAMGLSTSINSTNEFTINGTVFNFNSTETMQNIMNSINSADIGVSLSYSDITDKFTLVSTDTGSASYVNWSESDGNFLTSILGTGVMSSGTDAVLTVGLNGSSDESSLTTITRSSNSFEINGSTYKLLNKASGTAKEGITVSFGYDVDDLESKIADYISGYNTLLKTVTDLLSEKVYKDYEPLTSTQKDAMTDTQITQWEAKAKSGLLNSDTYLKSIYNSLRSLWFDSVSNLTTGSSLSNSLTDIGITTGDYSQMGQLKIDEDTLKNALNSDPSGVLQLLTQSSSVNYSQYSTAAQKKTRYAQSGLLWRVADIVRNNLSTTGTKGALITLVGNPANSYTGTTTYSTKISKQEDTITDLETKLTTEQAKYWKIYSNLESLMVKNNATATWLASAFSS